MRQCLGISVTPQTKEKLKKLAKKNETTISAIVKKAISAYLLTKPTKKEFKNDEL